MSQASNYTYNPHGEKDLSTILSEARKYKVGLILANQFISQLERGAKEAIFGNVGSKIAFRVGFEDARFLSILFGSNFKPYNFLDLPNYYAYASMLVNNTEINTFTIKTLL